MVLLRKDSKGKTGLKYDSKCAFYQTEFNGGLTCNYDAHTCFYKHDKCRSQAEYDKLYKPWEDPHKTSTPRKIKSRSKSAKANANTPEKTPAKTPEKKEPPKRVFAAQANYQSFCKNHMSCTNADCKKLHLTEDEAKKQIALWSELKDKPPKRSASSRRGRAGRPDTPRS